MREVIGAMRGLEKGDDPNKRRDPDLEPRPLRMQLPPETYALFLVMAVACRAVLGREASEDSPNTPPHQISTAGRTSRASRESRSATPGPSAQLEAATVGPVAPMRVRRYRRTVQARVATLEHLGELLERA